MELQSLKGLSEDLRPALSGIKEIQITKSDPASVFFSILRKADECLELFLANECRLSDLEARPIGTWLSERKDTALRKVNLDSNCFTAQGILTLVYGAGEGYVEDLSLDGNEYLWFESSNVWSFSCASQAAGNMV